MPDSKLTPEALAKAREYCLDEFKDHVVYERLAEGERDERIRGVLEKLSEEEHRHYQFWSEMLGGDCRHQLSTRSIRLVELARRVFGLTFTLKFLELHERSVIEEYRSFLSHLEGEDRRRLEEIIEDEVTHESSLIGGIDETVVRYLSFIALGLADAIVEISGVHTGFLGATKTTIVSGIAGLIVGVSAAFSMAGAAYLQAKAEAPTGSKGRTPAMSSIVTGLSYMVSVVLLALPYFLTGDQLKAFLASISLAVLIVSGFTFYNSVISESNFRREIAENLLILFGTAFIAYLFGDVIGAVFGLQHIL